MSVKRSCFVSPIHCYDSLSILFQLRKWKLLDRHPVLLLARRTANGFLAECFCPWEMNTEGVKDALFKIKKIYENLLNGNVQYTLFSHTKVPSVTAK